MVVIKMKRGKTILGITAIAVALASIIPVIAHIIFSALGYIFTMIGAGFSLLAAWFAKASDEPHEKAIWGGILLALIMAMIYYLGLPLLKYWWLIILAIIIFLIAVFNAWIRKK